MAVNQFEMLQSLIRRIQNRIVRESFREDIADDDIATPEGFLKAKCLHHDNDTGVMTLMRLFLFYVIREEGRRLHPAMYTYPVDDYQASVKFKPQVVFWFWEPQNEAKTRKRPAKRVRASFRLVRETLETLTVADVDRLKQRVKAEFPRSYRFKTGRLKASYRDKENGLELTLAPYSRTEAKEFIGKILDVADVTPDWDLFSISEYPDRNFSEQSRITILGESKKLPDKRPIANVYLKKAELHIHGNTESMVLYDSYSL